jgi:hypothetical protein
MFCINAIEMFLSEHERNYFSARQLMSKLSMLWVVPVIAALSGCGVAAKVNARNDMQGSKTAYKTCLAQHLEDAAACEGPRQAYEADLSAYRATSAATRQAPVYSTPEPVLAPNFGAGAIGQQVYSRNECIGPVVMGVCHGAILPQSANHPTCYGQMLNGVCTGPMF